MVKIVDNNIWRGRQKIGWFYGDDIVNMSKKKIGHFKEGLGDVFGVRGRKVGYIRGNEFIVVTDGKSIRLDEIRKDVVGGSATDLARAAVWLLLGS